MAIDQFHCGPIVRDAHDAEHRTEDFLAVDAHLGAYRVEQRRPEEEAAGQRCGAVSASIQYQARALAHPELDVVAYSGQVRRCDQRAHFHTGSVGSPDIQVRQPLGEFFDQGIGEPIAHGDRDRDRHAALTGRTIGGSYQCLGGSVEVCIRHHHHVILGAAQRLHALVIGNAARLDVARDRGRSHETQRRNLRMIQQRVHRFPVTLDDVEHPVRQAGLRQQCGQQQ